MDELLSIPDGVGARNVGGEGLLATRIRSYMWRLGRAMYRRARREGVNSPDRNGEYWLLDQIVRLGESDLTLFDVGANRGAWTAEATDALERHGRKGTVHAFEPARETQAHLSRRFGNASGVHVHPLALSDRAGQSTLYVVGTLSGQNSLLPVEGSNTEDVVVNSIDSFRAEAGVDRIAMVKTDTEGNDLSVLEGARGTLAAGLVDAWQFEYNHRWLEKGSSLLGLFRFIEPLNYRVGKLYGNGIEFYDEWHFELDRFIEANYVLVRRGTPIEALGRVVRFDGSNAPC